LAGGIADAGPDAEGQSALSGSRESAVLSDCHGVGNIGSTGELAVADATSAEPRSLAGSQNELKTREWDARTRSHCGTLLLVSRNLALSSLKEGVWQIN
jgi:hypothetical protein